MRRGGYIKKKNSLSLKHAISIYYTSLMCEGIICDTILYPVYYIVVVWRLQISRRLRRDVLRFFSTGSYWNSTQQHRSTYYSQFNRDKDSITFFSLFFDELRNIVTLSRAIRSVVIRVHNIYKIYNRYRYGVRYNIFFVVLNSERHRWNENFTRNSNYITLIFVFVLK